MVEAKSAELQRILSSCAPMLVAYSGGVDSAYLAYAGRQAVGRESLLALIADSPSLPRAALRDALAFAQAHDIPCETVATDELDRAEYRKNSPDRCFHCKDTLFTRMEQELETRSFRTLVYGVNADDTTDFRPGHRAAKVHGVRAPLLEAGLAKAEIRALAREAGLEVWDRPAAACLSSRVAHGIEVTPEVLARIEQGESALHELGFRQVRVRYHGDIARLEIAREELERALNLEMAGKLAAIFKSLGFHYVTLDLEGYRTGAMNEALTRIAGS